MMVLRTDLVWSRQVDEDDLFDAADSLHGAVTAVAEEFRDKRSWPDAPVLVIDAVVTLPIFDTSGWSPSFCVAAEVVAPGAQ